MNQENKNALGRAALIIGIIILAIISIVCIQAINEQDEEIEANTITIQYEGHNETLQNAYAYKLQNNILWQTGTIVTMLVALIAIFTNIFLIITLIFYEPKKETRNKKWNSHTKKI